MKNILFSLLFLTGCSMPIDVKLGDKVRVTNGFFKGCLGEAKDFSIWMLPCQERTLVYFDNCGEEHEYISNCDLEIIK